MILPKKKKELTGNELIEFINKNELGDAPVMVYSTKYNGWIAANEVFHNNKKCINIDADYK